jgi:nucleoside-diphosphate-sugar epimerase
MIKDNSPKVLITGANGFIDRSLCAFLKEKGYALSLGWKPPFTLEKGD